MQPCNLKKEATSLWWWHRAPDAARERGRRQRCENTKHHKYRCNRLDRGFHAINPTNNCSSPSGLLWCSAYTFIQEWLDTFFDDTPPILWSLFGPCLLSRFWIPWWPRTVYQHLLSSFCTCSASLQWNSLWKKRSIMDFRTHLALRASLWRSGKTET